MSGCRIKSGMTDKAVYGKTLLIYAMLYALCFILSACEKTLFPDCSKMPRCKAPEILRSEAYLDVRRNNEG
jgi:hypothetical protein